MRYALAAILAFVALNAIGGGVYGVMGARDVPREWLRGSPFSNYLVPTLILIAAVGGSSLWACLAVLRGLPSAVFACYASGVILLAWIASQVAIIGFVSPLQPAFFAFGVLILLLARRLTRSP